MSFDVMNMLPALKAYPTADLDLRCTSLDLLPRLGKRLDIELFVKRDDTLPLAMGGNKVRQLEYYLGPAVRDGADTVLITGAVQSNFVRLCAAAARKLGMKAVVQLEDRVPKDDAIYKSSGNVLLSQLFGAETHYFPEGENEAAADANLDRMADELRAKGHRPYVVHLGIEHPPLGGLGYAYCAAECFAQFKELGVMPDHVVIASGSGLTHAGFLAGARAVGWDVPVHGICVRRESEQQHARITQRAAELEAMLGNSGITPADIMVYDSVLAPGYGQMNEQVMAAITHSAQDEALLLDPVYTGRTMAGLIDLVKGGLIKSGSRVAFIHTGGLPSIFAYQSDIMSGLNKKGTKRGAVA
jgi:1-aminocyclopropane-1-carboxylate deaminase/D-cysteine desulfhydrase-like pyridoxal-dependent ACC family enzyme